MNTVGMMQVSVIVCCYNSSKRIVPTLTHLINQKTTGLNWEIVVVDNNSSDDSNRVIQNFIAQHANTVDCKLIEQPKPGLAFARIKGVEESSGQFILFCDDDNWLDENYVSNAYKIMSGNSAIGMLGGIGEAVTEIIAPDWFSRFQSLYAVGPQNKIPGDITKYKACVYGGGVVVRREIFTVLKKIQFENVLTDRIGTKMVSGGDNEIGYAAVLLGYSIHYDPILTFKHFIPSQRLTIKYISSFFEGQTLTTTATSTYEKYLFRNDRSYSPLTAKLLFKELFQMIKNSINLVLGRNSYLHFYLHFNKTVSQINYYFCCKDQDYKIFLKVLKNIDLLKSYSQNRKHSANPE